MQVGEPGAQVLQRVRASALRQRPARRGRRGRAAGRRAAPRRSDRGRSSTSAARRQVAARRTPTRGVECGRTPRHQSQPLASSSLARLAPRREQPRRPAGRARPRPRAPTASARTAIAVRAGRPEVAGRRPCGRACAAAGSLERPGCGPARARPRPGGGAAGAIRRPAPPPRSAARPSSTRPAAISTSARSWSQVASMTGAQRSEHRPRRDPSSRRPPTRSPRQEPAVAEVVLAPSPPRPAGPPRAAARRRRAKSRSAAAIVVALEVDVAAVAVGPAQERRDVRRASPIAHVEARPAPPRRAAEHAAASPAGSAPSPACARSRPGRASADSHSAQRLAGVAGLGLDVGEARLDRRRRARRRSARSAARLEEPACAA